MDVRKEGTTLIVDIHGMRYDDAKHRLIWLFGNQCKEIEQVIVIHGYRSGHILQDMVRKDVKHPRIKRKILSINPGETIFLLNKDGEFNVSKKNKKKV